MTARLHHICLCVIAFAGIFVSGEARAAFMPPELEARDSDSGVRSSASLPSSPAQIPFESPDPARVGVSSFAAANMSGSGLTPVLLSGAGPGGVLSAAACLAEPAAISRLHLAREKARESSGFVLDILRP